MGICGHLSGDCTKNKVVLGKFAVSEKSQKSTLAKEVKKTILDDDFWNLNKAAGPQRENFPGGTKVNTGPPNLIAPPPNPYRGAYR